LSMRVGVPRSVTVFYSGSFFFAKRELASMVPIRNCEGTILL
jgi:hypothetical protein